MTISKRNKGNPEVFSCEDELLLSKIEKAVTDEAVNAFETKLSGAFTRKSRFELTPMKIAAVFVITTSLFAGLHYIFNPAHKKLYYHYYKHFSAENISGSVRGKNDPMEEALLLYSGEKYEKAIPLFHDFLNQQPGDAEAKFLLAISLAETGKTGESLALLKEIVEAPENYYSDDALWYAALLEIKLSDYNSSRQLLLKIGTSSRYYPSARELLLKIKDK